MKTDHAPDSCPQCGYSASDGAPADDEREEEYYRDPEQGFKIIPIKGVKVPTKKERKMVGYLGTTTHRH